MANYITGQYETKDFERMAKLIAPIKPSHVPGMVPSALCSVKVPSFKEKDKAANRYIVGLFYAVWNGLITKEKVRDQLNLLINGFITTESLALVGYVSACKSLGVDFNVVLRYFNAGVDSPGMFTRAKNVLSSPSATTDMRIMAATMGLAGGSSTGDSLVDSGVATIKKPEAEPEPAKKASAKKAPVKKAADPYDFSDYFDIIDANNL